MILDMILLNLNSAYIALNFVWHLKEQMTMIAENLAKCHTSTTSLYVTKKCVIYTLDEKWKILVKEMCMTGLNFRHISLFLQEIWPSHLPNMCRVDQIS